MIVVLIKADGLKLDSFHTERERRGWGGLTFIGRMGRLYHLQSALIIFMIVARLALYLGPNIDQ
jgi:hypothetical protein